VIGEIADGINALWYAAEGDYTNAALSGAAVIPVVGDIGGKGFRQGKKLLKGAKALDKANDARRLYRRTTSTAEAAENLVRSSRKLDDIPALAKTGGKAPRGTGLVDDAAALGKTSRTQNFFGHGETVTPPVLPRAKGAPKTRPFNQLVDDIRGNPQRWEAISAHTEKATRKGARRHGVSTQTIYRNKDTGEMIVRHTVTDDAGRLIDDHFRPIYKPREGDLFDGQ